MSDVPAQSVDPTASLADDASVEAERVVLGPGAAIESGAHVEAASLVLGAGARIGARTRVKADAFELGFRSAIGSDCLLGAVGGRRAQRIALGDNSLIGDSTTVLLPVLAVGDYVALHHHSLVSGYESCVIGHNTWIGQNCVLNCTGRLTIGNNVGIGAYSSIYTHAYNGELLEGCQLWSVEPVTIEDNVWIIGSYNVISPGVTLGRRAVVITGSVVSKSVEPARVVAGVPARDLTEKLVVFSDLSLEAKLDLMRRFTREFVEELHPQRFEPTAHGYYVMPADRTPFTVAVAPAFDEIAANPEEELLAYVGLPPSEPQSSRVTVFDIATKRYTKRLSEAEIEIIRFMNGFRARFVPDDRPTVLVT